MTCWAFELGCTRPRFCHLDFSFFLSIFFFCPSNGAVSPPVAPSVLTLEVTLPLPSFVLLILQFLEFKSLTLPPPERTTDVGRGVLEILVLVHGLIVFDDELQRHFEGAEFQQQSEQELQGVGLEPVYYHGHHTDRSIHHPVDPVGDAKEPHEDCETKSNESDHGAEQGHVLLHEWSGSRCRLRRPHRRTTEDARAEVDSEEDLPKDEHRNRYEEETVDPSEWLPEEGKCVAVPDSTVVFAHGQPLPVVAPIHRQPVSKPSRSEPVVSCGHEEGVAPHQCLNYKPLPLAHGVIDIAEEQGQQLVVLAKVVPQVLPPPDVEHHWTELLVLWDNRLDLAGALRLVPECTGCVTGVGVTVAPECPSAHVLCSFKEGESLVLEELNEERKTVDRDLTVGTAEEVPDLNDEGSVAEATECVLLTVEEQDKLRVVIDRPQELLLTDLPVPVRINSVVHVPDQLVGDVVELPVEPRHRRQHQIRQGLQHSGLLHILRLRLTLRESSEELLVLFSPLQSTVLRGTVGEEVQVGQAGLGAGLDGDFRGEYLPGVVVV
eukprot:Hpha_TRINITY_DN11878_c0_g1::TRINITY_DN11878_c0_g1_i1::g.2059::m.2059